MPQVCTTLIQEIKGTDAQVLSICNSYLYSLTVVHCVKNKHFRTTLPTSFSDIEPVFTVAAFVALLLIAAHCVRITPYICLSLKW